MNRVLFSPWFSLNKVITRVLFHDLVVLKATKQTVKFTLLVEPSKKITIFKPKKGAFKSSFSFTKK